MQHLTNNLTIFYLEIGIFDSQNSDSMVKGTFYPLESADKNIKYVKTPHGRYQLYYNGFLYNRNMCSAQKTYW